MIRIVLADDHHLVRQGIRALLDRESDIEVVGEAGDGVEALELVEQVAPDVLVLDVAMPGLSGVQVAERVRTLAVGTQVLILSMYSDEALVRHALRNGARGYVLKRSVSEELLLAIRAAHRGDVYLSPSISHSGLTDTLERTEPEWASLSARLTSREREVLQLITEGYTNAAVADLLQIGVRTVERHRANLMAKLGAHDLSSLLSMAIQHRLIVFDM